MDENELSRIAVYTVGVLQRMQTVKDWLRDQFKDFLAEIFGVARPDEIPTKIVDADGVRAIIAEALGVGDPAQARGMIQTLVNEAVDRAGASPQSPSLSPRERAERLRDEIIPTLVVSVMNKRPALESLSGEEAEELMIDSGYVSDEFVRRIWDRGFLRDLWGSEEGLRERRSEAMAEFIEEEMAAMVTAMKKCLKRSRLAQAKANTFWGQYFLIRLGIDPADTKAVKTAMARQVELQDYLKVGS